jgi:hypothetical protein
MVWVGSDVILEPFSLLGMDLSDVCWKFEIFPLRALVLPMGKIHGECHGTFVPCVDHFLALIEPLFHLYQEGEGKQTEPCASWCDVFDDDGVA